MEDQQDTHRTYGKADGTYSVFTDSTAEAFSQTCLDLLWPKCKVRDNIRASIAIVQAGLYTVLLNAKTTEKLNEQLIPS